VAIKRKNEELFREYALFDAIDVWIKYLVFVDPKVSSGCINVQS
jgi:hypothetical protein